MPSPKRKRRPGAEMLFGLNMSDEEVVTRIKDQYPLEEAIWIARQELEFRKSAREKQRESLLAKMGITFSDEEPTKTIEEYRKMQPMKQARANQEYTWELIHGRARIHYSSFRAIGTHMSFDDMLSEICEVFMKCQHRFNELGKAKFETYLDVAIKNRIKTLWRQKTREREIMEEYREGVMEERRSIMMSDYPIKVCNKWVQGVPQENNL